MADGNTFRFAARGSIEDDQVRTGERGDKGQLAVQRKFEAVGAADVCGERLRYFFGGEIDDGDGAILRVSDPDFLAVGRDVKTFRAIADIDDGLIPISAWWARRRPTGRCSLRRIWSARRRAGRGAGRRFFNDAYRGCAGVGGDDAFQVRGDIDHVGAILSRSEDPIEFVRSRIVAADGFGGFSGEPDFPCDKIEAVRS